MMVAVATVVVELVAVVREGGSLGAVEKVGAALAVAAQ